MRKTATLATLGLVTSLLGCSSSGSPSASSDASTAGVDSSAGSGDAATGGSDAASGDASDGAAMGVGAFVGTWAGSQSIEQTCPGDHVTDLSVSGNFVITLGTTTGTIATTQPDGCPVTYTVAGSTASTDAGQPCSATSDAGVVESTFTVVTDTLAVSSDGTTLTETDSDDVAVALPDGGTNPCTASVTGTFTKQ